MKKALCTASVLLSSLLAVSTASYASHHPVLSAKLDEAKFNHTIKQTKRFNDFEQTLAAIQNDQVGDFFMLSSDTYTKSEMLQLIEAVKSNSSITYFLFWDSEANSINYGDGRHDARVVNALVDLFSTSQTLTTVVLLGDHMSSDLDETVNGVLDSDSLSQIDNALQENANITDVRFYGWDASRSMGRELANFIKEKNTLTSFSVDFKDCGWNCSAAADTISSAVIGSSIDSVNFYMYDEHFTNTAIAENIINAALKKPKMQALSLDGFPIDLETSQNLSILLESSTSLDKLQLSENKMSGKTFAAMVPGLAKNTSLTNFGLYNQELSDTINTVLLMNMLSNNPNLEHFSLDDVFTKPLTNDIWQLVASKLANNTSLKSLELSDMQMTDADLATLGTAIATNQSLTMLLLHSNDFTAAGIDAFIPSLEQNHSLQWTQVSTRDEDEDISAQEAKIEAIMQRNWGASGSPK